MSAAEELKKMMQELSLMTQKVSEEAVPASEISEGADIIPETKAMDELKKLMEEAASTISKSSKKKTTNENVEEDPTLRIKALSERLSKTRTLVEQQDSLEPLNQKFITVDAFNKHYNDFLLKIQKQLSSLGGGGEVNFRYLDDVNRATMTANDNNHVLEYDAATGKVQFTDEIGPIGHIHFDLDHTHEEERLVGTLCWDNSDQTLRLTHPGGVDQQIGQESYAYVRNRTGSTITNGTAVMFAGAEQDGDARLLVGPLVSNGTFPSLYGLGISTQDIGDGEDGRVTVWGKVRDANTAPFEVGDILYADPDNAGFLTNVKPTAPNNVIPLAAVLKKDGTTGEIFVRPTIEQQKYYGRFSRLTDVAVANENQAYPIAFDTVDISNGVTFNGPSDTQIKVADSGFYNFSVAAQVTASSNKGLVYLWFRKNGVDIPNSTRSTTVTNGDTFNVATSISISLAANDYVEVVWARTAAGITLDAIPATAFAPSTSAITINVVQTQL